MLKKHGADGICITGTCTQEGFIQYIINCDYCPRVYYNSSNNTWISNWEQHVAPTKPNNKRSQKDWNHFSMKGLFANQPRINNFAGFACSLPRKPITIDQFEEPNLASLCLGLPVEEESMEEDLLFNMRYREGMEFVPVFRPIPIYVKALEGTEAKDKYVGHSFRHSQCAETSPFLNRPFLNHICVFCSTIVHLRSFQREMEKREKGMILSRAYTDDHVDHIIFRLHAAAKSNTSMRRQLRRRIQRDVRAPPTLEKSLKVSVCCLSCLCIIVKLHSYVS